MTVETLLIQTEAWAQEELAAKRRLLEHLAAQEGAVRKADDPGLAIATKGLQAELQREAPRAGKRAALIVAFGDAFGVDPAGLTLSDIAARADAQGLDTSRLRGLRDELRSTTALAIRRGRLVATLARHHGELLNQILSIVVSAPPGASAQVDGALIDARG